MLIGDLRAADRAARARRCSTATRSCCRRSGRRAARPEFLLGTDAVGRDILSRLIYGARFSLVIGARRRRRSRWSAASSLGLLAGYFRGWVDAVIMRVMDIILAFPSLLLALVLVAILGPGLFNAMLAIASCCSRISPG